MKKSKFYLITALAAVVVTTAVVAGIAYAQGWGADEGPPCPWGCRLENREAIREAIENNDYNAWLEAVGEDSKIAEFITEENFSRFVEMHKLMEEGREKFAEAREIGEELGLPLKGRRVGWYGRPWQE